MTNKEESELEMNFRSTGEIYPVMTEEQVSRARTYGSEVTLRPNQILYSRGALDYDFFLVLTGAVELHSCTQGKSYGNSLITVYKARQFTGELALLNRQPSLVHAEVRDETTAIRLHSSQLRRMLAAEPDISRVVIRAYMLRRIHYIHEGHGTAIVAGPPFEASTLRIRRFLERNNYPIRQVDTSQPAAIEELADSGVLPNSRWPVVIFHPGSYIENPTLVEVAERLGIHEKFDNSKTFDVAVVGAGPAGLAAAVYAASEGLKTVVVEAEAPGGQAGTSSMIENYLGFPLGVSGSELAARAQVQARKFGARFALPRMVKRIHCGSSPFILQIDTGERISTRTVVIATGARYRRLELPELSKYEGSGVHYAATALESSFCANEDVVIAGGANSAGQAAIFLSRTASQVTMLVRGSGLASTMSQYLLTRIEASRNISIQVNTEITALEGDRHLESVRWSNRMAGTSGTHRTANTFLMLGAVPNTSWLDGCLELDEKGFILVGSDVARTEHYPAHTFPGAMESSVPGIFAAGDVRAGSVKRVASAVGEGAMVISSVHQAISRT
ncbi:FAD-dependent oxidoreductase [Streptomyces sp. NPDC095817]|uniref:FAD-dependent oxidoreductase n=1 Tax=Streptomyces sp. NPDC095817 TaxID=3155082 RepID=UPI00332C2332